MGKELKGPEEPFWLQIYNFCSLNMNLLENAAHFGPDVSYVQILHVTVEIAHLISELQERAGL